MEFDRVLRTDDIFEYADWLDEETLVYWMKCVEYLIDKHNYNQIVVKHKKIDGW